MNRTERSFTLLELILVVILIGIMTGVGIPGYQKAIEKMKKEPPSSSSRPYGRG